MCGGNLPQGRQDIRPDFHARTIKSFGKDEHLQYLRKMVCLTIASVLPDESNDHKQEMWVIQASDRDEIAVFCSRNEWEQVQQSCEHAKECGWPTFMAQKAQDAHDRRHLQLAEQTASDHFVKVLREPEYWRNIRYQARNNNLLLVETIKLIEQMKDGDIDIFECGIEIGYNEQLYY